MVSQKIAHQLAQWIESGRVPVGSYLPSTRELASRFNISQHTVGAALKHLESLHLVECLPRQGAKVKAHTPRIEPQVKQIAVFVVNKQDWISAPHITSEWGWQIIHYFEQELFGAGFSLTPISPLRMEESDGITLEQRLDRLGPTLCGAVCFAVPSVMEIIDQLQQRDVPWISINQPSRRINHNYVGADNIRSGWKVGRLFAECGYERVLLLHNGAARPSNGDKLAGFFQGYLEKSEATLSGIRSICAVNHYEMESYRAVQAALKDGYRPQGIFATGDFLATGAIHALRDAGLHVPEDVSVIGGTGLAASDHLDPPLSVLAEPMEQIGRTAGKILREMISEGTRRYAPRLLDCPLILRGSTNVPEEILRKLSEDPEWDSLASNEP